MSIDIASSKTSSAAPRPIPVDPRVLVLAGTLAISSTGIFIGLADVSPATATFFRCVVALPVLAVLARRELVRRGRPPARSVLMHAIGGLFLGVDFALWSQSISLIGAGISTVVMSVQVVVVPVLAWMILRARVPGQFVLAVPVLFVGIALASGAVSNPHDQSLVLGVGLALGSGVAYGVYIFTAGRDRDGAHSTTGVLVSTVTAGVSGSMVGSIWGAVDLTPGWRAVPWLIALAVVGQVLGWMLIGHALPSLPSEVGATLLLVQPVLTVLLGVLILREKPTMMQFVGCTVVVIAIWGATHRRPVEHSWGSRFSTGRAR
ncbi:DMT family transporter [Rhodococcus sp. 1R11]|uniref:DMT family transporter n=1 Tax=Rhodococcus ruber TaxID=1830 RepID=A0ABT4MMQ7_9NOCA|nr:MULTISPECIES: DMT family transporter [Rhodococcus]MCZ4522272.1 DMT family transporter [Rhodococcus ruber]TFI40227.1 DMT family transporter [Rhodococcus sp. 1R11]